MVDQSTTETQVETPVAVPEAGTETPIEATVVETPVETPAEEPIDTPVEPVAVPQFEDQFKEKFGFGLDQLEKTLTDYDGMKDRKFIEDDELVADDDFLKDFVRNYKRGGDAKSYLEAMTVDYGKMSPEDVIKHDLRKNNPSANSEYIDFEYNRIVDSKFGAIEDEGKKAEFIDYYAAGIRKNLSEAQKQFKIPERVQPEPVETEAVDIEAITREIQSNASTKSLIESKKVVFGDFNYEVDAEKLVQQTIDGSWFDTNFKTEDGSLDMPKWYKAMAIIRDPDGFLASNNAHVAAKAVEAHITGLKNPSDENPKPSMAKDINVKLVRPG